MFSRVIFLFVFSTSFLSALSLTCLSCKEIAHPRYCHIVAECGASQRCFAKSITTTDHRKAYELGCTDQHTLDSTQCNTTKVGANGQSCFGCCTSDLCNAALCGEQGYPVKRGPICYSCDSRERGEPCNQVAFCSVGEVCSIEERVEFSTAIYIAECRPKHVCESHGLAIIGKRSVREGEPLDLEIDPDLGKCHKCCSEDLCNTNCSPMLNTDNCQTNPCMNGGSCHNNQSGYVCICPSGWLGKNCHIVDYCQSNPCMNGGSCHNNQSGYVCICPSDWLGKICHIVDRCSVERPCKYGSTCLNNGRDYSCVCPPGLTGRRCDIGVDCSSFSGANMTSNNSDIYQVWLPQQHMAKRVVCDVTTDGGGWLVMQRRFNGSVSFYRNFNEYEQGFGELSGEFWMGLRDVHELMSCGTWEVRFDLEDAEGLTGYQTYQEFRIASTPKYTLHIGLSNGTANRKYDEWGGFTYNNGSDFSTYDYGRRTNCGTRYRGGWWYDSCTYVNINGEYGHPPGSKSSFNSGWAGMSYNSFDLERTLKSTEMKIRRVSRSGC